MARTFVTITSPDIRWPKVSDLDLVFKRASVWRGIEDEDLEYRIGERNPLKHVTQQRRASADQLKTVRAWARWSVELFHEYAVEAGPEHPLYREWTERAIPDLRRLIDVCDDMLAWIGPSREIPVFVDWEEEPSEIVDWGEPVNADV